MRTASGLWRPKNRFSANVPMTSKFPKLNQVILIIIFAEFLFTAAAGLVTPIFAVFVLENIRASAITVVGFATALYWIVKSVLQLPIARYLDKNHGEIDDFYSLLVGVAVTTGAVFAFYFSREVWHIYLLQFLIAVGDAFAVPPFYAIFTRHLDPQSTGFEWALRSSFSLGAGSAIGGALSGILAAAIGIRAVYLLNGTLMLVGLIIMFFLRPYIRPKVPTSVGRVFMEQKRV